jgi:hypothetical protein
MNGEDITPVDGKRPSWGTVTKGKVEWVRWLLGVLAVLVGAGWFGRSYIDSFATKEDLDTAQVVNSQAHEQLQTGIDTTTKRLDSVRLYNVRIELEQRNTNDRLDAIRALQGARTASDRREAQSKVLEIDERIRRRERIVRNPAALQQVADQVEENPLVGLDGL